MAVKALSPGPFFCACKITQPRARAILGELRYDALKPARIKAISQSDKDVTPNSKQ